MRSVRLWRRLNSSHIAEGSLVRLLDTNEQRPTVVVEDLSAMFQERGVQACEGRPPVAMLLHHFLSEDECLRLLSATRGDYQPSSQLYPPSYRNNQLYDVVDEPLQRGLFARMERFVPAQLDWPNRGTVTSPVPGAHSVTFRLHSLNPLWRFSRYSERQHFRPHLDGHYRPSPDLESKLSVTIYLNDQFTKGETIFYADQSLRDIVVKVKPKMGTCALFDHDLWHDGSPVATGSKYILRSDVVFQLAKKVSLPKSNDHQQQEMAQKVMGASAVPLNYSRPTLASPHSMVHHANYVFDLLSLPNGRLLSASRDTTMAEWGVDGRVAQVYRGHTRSVLCIAEADGRVVTGSRDFSLRVWKLGDPQCCHVVHNAHSGNVLTVAPVSAATGHQFLTGGSDGAMRYWRITDEKLEMLGENCNAHSSWVYCIAPHKDHTVFTCSEDGFVKRWHFDTSSNVYQMIAETDLEAPVYNLRILSNMLISVDELGRITMLNEELHVIKTFKAHTRAIRSVVELERGVIATASEDGTIKVWDISELGNPVELVSLSSHHNFVRSLSLLPNGRLASGSYDGRIKLWDFCQKT